MATAVFGGSPRHHNRNVIIGAPNPYHASSLPSTNTLKSQSASIRSPSTASTGSPTGMGVSTTIYSQTSFNLISPKSSNQPSNFYHTNVHSSHHSYQSPVLMHHQPQQQQQQQHHYGHHYPIHQHQQLQQPSSLGSINSHHSNTTTISDQQLHHLHQQQSQQQHQHQHHQQSHPHQNYRHSKRKSAVELLAESKSYYVKSEMVLDRQQQLNYRSSTGAAGNASNSSISTCGLGGILSSPSRTLPSKTHQQQQQQHHHHQHQQQLQQHQHSQQRQLNTGSSPQQNHLINRRNSSSSILKSEDLLQNKLRKLLNTQSSSTISDSGGSGSGSGNKDIIHDFKMGTLNKLKLHDSPSSAVAVTSKYELNKYLSPKRFNQELTIHAGNSSGCGGGGGSLNDPNNDVSVFFPSAFLSPQSLPPNPASDDDLYIYEHIDGALDVTDDYLTISPPAEYAAVTTTTVDDTGRGVTNANRHNNQTSSYQRSYSHSQAITSDETDGTGSPTSYNINSHKSLPDLHAQISSRHSPHSEVLSCGSRGNRSNKSNNSFNRDSGGSSGHYTHRSEPYGKQPIVQQPYQSSQQHHHHHHHSQQQQQQQQQFQSHQQPPQQQQQLQNRNQSDYRRDSGSSTQHSGNSYYAYGIPPLRYDCLECRAKIQSDNNYLLNFTTPEVPEAFQDDYNKKSTVKSQLPPTPRYNQKMDDTIQKHFPTTKKYNQNNNQNFINSSSNSSSSNPNNYNTNNSKTNLKIYPQKPPNSPKKKQQQKHQSLSDYNNPHNNNSSSHDNNNELSPPLGTFKRQKCLRIKQRNGRYLSPGGRTTISSIGSNTGGATDGSCTLLGHSDENNEYNDGDDDAENDYNNDDGNYERNDDRKDDDHLNMENDDRRPILRSKSDISDRYWNRNIGTNHQLLDGGYPSRYNNNKTVSGQVSQASERQYENLSQLANFFDKLGLNEENYDRIILPKVHRHRKYSNSQQQQQQPHLTSNSSSSTSPPQYQQQQQQQQRNNSQNIVGIVVASDSESNQSSPVFFSDVSTVDSTRLPDSTVDTTLGAQPPQRQTMPPSIVERNARIIKWLCNCRKLQSI